MQTVKRPPKALGDWARATYKLGFSALFLVPHQQAAFSRTQLDYSGIRCAVLDQSVRSAHLCDVCLVHLHSGWDAPTNNL